MYNLAGIIILYYMIVLINVYKNSSKVLDKKIILLGDDKIFILCYYIRVRQTKGNTKMKFGGYTKAYKRNAQTKLLFLYKNNYISRTRFIIAKENLIARG